LRFTTFGYRPSEAPKVNASGIGSNENSFGMNNITIVNRNNHGTNMFDSSMEAQNLKDRYEKEISDLTGKCGNLEKLVIDKKNEIGNLEAELSGKGD